MSASTALAMAGMGSSCPGTGSTANFDNPALLAYLPAQTFLRSWQSAMVIDIGAASATDSTFDHDQNVFSSGTVAIYPSAVFHDADEKFYAIFTRGTGVPPLATGSVNVFATQQNDMKSTTWVSGLGSFTQLDVSTSIESFQVKAAVDQAGNVTSYFSASPPPPGVASHRQLKSSRHTYGNGTWDAPVTISNTANTNPVGGGAGGLVQDVQNNTAAAVDGFGNTVVVWVQAVAGINQAFFNEYRPNLGWRFSSVNPTVPWNDMTTNDPVIARGVDVGFDSFGNGYGIYVTQPLGAGPNVIKSARWRNDKPENFPLTTVGFGGADGGDVVAVSLPGHAVFGYPRIYVAPNGAGTAFWYEATGQLWWARTGPNNMPSTGTWSQQARFDLSFGAASYLPYNLETSQGYYIPPILAGDGAVAAIATIKFDGTNRRLFVSRSTDSGASWASLGTADLSGFTRDVDAANIAVNQNGDIVVAYSANDPADFREHVYGNVYTQGNWSGVVQLDFNNSVLASGRPNYALPNVSIDELGNACAVYTINDVLFSPSRRRVLANFYR